MLQAVSGCYLKTQIIWFFQMIVGPAMHLFNMDIKVLYRNPNPIVLSLLGYSSRRSFAWKEDF